MSGVGSKEKVDINEFIKNVENHDYNIDSPVHKLIVSITKHLVQYMQQVREEIENNLGMVKFNENSALANQAALSKEIGNIKDQLQDVGDKVDKSIEGNEVIKQYSIFDTLAKQATENISFIIADLTRRVTVNRDLNAKKLLNQISPINFQLHKDVNQLYSLNIQFLYYSDPVKKENILKKLDAVSDEIDKLSQTVSKIYEKFVKEKDGNQSIIDIITGSNKHPSK
jgi:hypothetical protein